MFQRLKGAIDSRIAEEQARQKALQSSPSRSNSTVRRSSSRTVSPSKRQARTRDRSGKDIDAEKGPDPSEFDRAFVVDDEESSSRVGTPGPGAERSGSAMIEGAGNDKAPVEDNKESNGKVVEDGDAPAPPELPTDVRVKLRKLDKLESRYQDLLRSYRIAHARVSLIEPFETSLRENTPLTSINDPSALVEYLNQLNLKGDMVLDELKRVSSERDTFKQKLLEAEKSTRDAWDEVAKLREQKAYVQDQSGSSKDVDHSISGPQVDTSETPIDNIVNATGTLKGSSSESATPKTRHVSPVSLKSQAGETQVTAKENEEFFSYDSELPRLQSELETRQNEIDGLKSEIKSLKGDLAVARESTESMAQSLEDATRELNVLRDSKGRYENELEIQRTSYNRTVDELKSGLHGVELDLTILRSEKSSTEATTAELESRLQASSLVLKNLQSERKDEVDRLAEGKQLRAEAVELSSKVSNLRTTNADYEKQNETLTETVNRLEARLSEADRTQQKLQLEVQDRARALEALEALHARSKSDVDGANDQSGVTTQATTAPVTNGDVSAAPKDTTGTPNSAVPAKKKNKKRKKAAKSSTEQVGEPTGQTAASTPVSGDAKNLKPASPPSDVSRSDILVLQEELQSLRQQLTEKDAAIERMIQRAKSQDDLQDEIEGLRDDLIHVGQEHVEAKDRIKELLSEKNALEGTVASLEKDLADVKANLASDAAGSEDRHKDLAAEFDDLKIKASTLQTDLSAAQQLAASRFKELTGLREVLQKAQPELVSLRSEVGDLKTVKNELSNKSNELRRLETKHEDLRSELTGFKKIAADREWEIKTLNQKISQETRGRLKAEEAHTTAQESIERLENEKRGNQEALDKANDDITRAEEELSVSRGQLHDLEQQVTKLGRDAQGLREEIELKTAQHASAQSLMGSMRDQTAEMAMQMREARERCESLDEELGDAHRLLNERTREGETMRRLLADVEGRADSRVRELKDRLETAIEERDRAEDEASTISRKRGREVEELKGKVRDMERSLKRAENDREELETAQKELRRRREELEAKAEKSSREVDDVRQAMSELRDAFDESERQAREVENEKADLQRSVEETRHRLEKLQKSNKAMADELRLLQNTKNKALESGGQSSRSSLDSTPSRARLGSPAPKTKSNPTAATDGSNGPSAGTMDYIYLKNVLLQFLEQKDKKHQMQLIPVLGMLLHFDRKDEQKWMAALTTK